MEMGQIIALGMILLLSVFLYFIVVRSNKKNKLIRDSLKEVEVREKQEKEDEVKSNLLIEESENKLKERKKIKELKDKIWKKSRIGLFIFIFPHIIFEIVVLNPTGSGVNMLPVIANFYITRYIIKKQIFDKNKTINSPILYGLGISIIVFSIRLLLGVLFSLYVL